MSIKLLTTTFFVIYFSFFGHITFHLTFRIMYQFRMVQEFLGNLDIQGFYLFSWGLNKNVSAKCHRGSTIIYISLFCNCKMGMWGLTKLKSDINTKYYYQNIIKQVDEHMCLIAVVLTIVPDKMLRANIILKYNWMCLYLILLGMFNFTLNLLYI